jgi:hypothetical protein
MNELHVLMFVPRVLNFYIASGRWSISKFTVASYSFVVIFIRSVCNAFY